MADSYFIFPAILNEEWLQETIVGRGGYYPRLEHQRTGGEARFSQYVSSLMPFEEELRMFHRLQFWRRLAIGMTACFLTVTLGAGYFSHRIFEPTLPSLRGEPVIELFRALPEITPNPTPPEVDPASWTHA